MGFRSVSRAALDKFERDMNEQAGPLVTKDQLDRILSISSIADPAERVARLNEIHEDLQRQVAAIEDRWQVLERQLNRIQFQLPCDQQRLVDEQNADLISSIRAEAASLLSHSNQAASPTVPRRLRMTI